MAEKWEPIVISAKVFGHVSQGMYRTPAGAIKELISNSFDADAGTVRIHTDFPRFTMFSCEDTGSGMTQKEFLRLMQQGIGTSFKRTDSESTISKGGRPFIGRLGLGILSLAQICSRFDIISHHKATQTAFKATIKFPPYGRQVMDKIKRPKAKDPATIAGGEYQIETIEFDAERPGVRIFTNFLREAYTKRMSSLALYAGKRAYRSRGPYKTFDKFLDAIYKKRPPIKSLNLGSDYDQLLFGLALAAPLPCIPERNVAAALPSMALRQAAIEKYDFEVHVDNIKLLQPVCLPSDAIGHTAEECHISAPSKLSFDVVDGASTQKCEVQRRHVTITKSQDRFNLYEFKFNDTVAGTKLSFSGYLFQQTGRLYPRDIQGILIRINNVAIGKYDNSMLAYPYAEGPRYSMVSSELFINAGFEDALNIDRDSFNELHPHYIRVQAYMHDMLHSLIFPETWNEEKGRNKAKRTRASQASEKGFVARVSATMPGTFERIVRLEPKKGEPRPAVTKPADIKAAAKESPVSFAPRLHEIKIDRRHLLLQQIMKKAKYIPLMEKIVIAFERANQEKNDSQRRELFYKLLLEIVQGL